MLYKKKTMKESETPRNNLVVTPNRSYQTYLVAGLISR